MRVPRWVPTAVTASRGLAGPVLLVLLPGLGWGWVAFWVFVFAMLTDLVDGALARAAGTDPALGALLDPLADKALVDCAWIALGLHGWAPWSIAGLHVVRDVAIGLGWWHWRRRGVLITSNRTGQVAVSYEGTAVAVLLFHGPWNGTDWPTVGVVLGATSLLLSSISALLYGYYRWSARASR